MLSAFRPAQLLLPAFFEIRDVLPLEPEFGSPASSRFSVSTNMPVRSSAAARRSRLDEQRLVRVQALQRIT